jgi:phosphotransferase system IIB component
MPDEVIEEVADEIVDDGAIEYGDDFDVFGEQNDTVEMEKDEAISATTEETETKSGETAETVEEDVSEDKETSESDEVVKEANEAVEGGFKNAYHAEKAKRQAYEQIIKDLNIGKKTDETAVQEDQEPEFDWTDPNKTITRLRDDMKTETLIIKADLSEAQAKRNHTDYDEKYQIFLGICNEDKSVYHEMLKQPDPAEWAYQKAKNHSVIAEIGNDPAAYKEKLKAEILAELKGGKIEETIKKVTETTYPPSGNKNTGKVVKQEPENDDPLGSIFGDR